MKNTLVCLILLALSPISQAQLPGAVCDQCGVFCDAATCEALGGGGNCLFNGDPLASEPAGCTPCGEIVSCDNYFPAGAPEKISTNLCARDPCRKNCGLSPDLVCRSCKDIRDRGDCEKYVAGSFRSDQCCTTVGGEDMSTEDAQKIEDTTDDIEQMDEFWKADCFCGCGKNDKGQSIAICASGLVPRTIDDQTGWDILGTQDKAKVACSKQCGKNCGQYAAECNGKTEGCTTCCEAYCNDGSSKNQYSGASKTECITSCKSTCGYKNLVGDLIGFIYTLSGMVGAIMIIIHAIRLTTSSDSHERGEAKKSIVYVLLALIVIALAGSMVSLFTDISGAARPEPCKVPGLSGSLILFMLKRKGS